MFYKKGGGMNKSIFAFFMLLACSLSFAKGNESFSNPETNFKLVMDKLLEKYIDKKLSKEELYRAATAGMLSSLNENDETWNKLLSPNDLRDLQVDLSGKVTGIGAAMKFDDRTGFGQILKSIPGSPAEKAGLRTDDQILSVDGQKFKGKQLIDLVKAIRGEVGKSVELRILREDKILTLNIKREIIPWTPVELEKVDNSTALLSIGFFSEQTPKLVENSLQRINRQGFKKLIVDVRDNDGGGFDQAVKVAELFLPDESVIASTKNRDGKLEKIVSTKGLLDKDVQLVVLTNKGTYSGAELLVAALRENKNIKIIGETTFGKWNAQSVETLPNKFAIKYTVKKFESPQGHTFQGVGIKPDLEVGLPKDVDIRELRSKYEVPKRLGFDLQLKAALELMKSI
jgi:carboxyl-terminal processing protease